MTTPPATGDMNLDQFASFLATLHTILVEEPARIIITDMLSSIYSALRSDVPVLTGALRDSLTPYVGSFDKIDLTFISSLGSEISSGVSVTEIMREWKFGEEVGIISALPYSNRVLLGGHSSKFPSGRLDLILEQSTNPNRSGITSPPS